MKAEFQQLGNNLYWSFQFPTKWTEDNTKYEWGEKLEWIGYNDSYWWHTVATEPGHNTRKDKAGNTYQLDYYTNLITLIP